MILQLVPTDIQYVMRRSLEAAALYYVFGEMKTIDVVQDRHVEWSGSRPLLLVAAHMEVPMIVPAVGQTMNEPGIAVECEDNGPVSREDRLELGLGEPVGMLTPWLQRHEINNVDDPDLELWDCRSKQIDRCESLHGWHVAGAGHYDVRLTTSVVACPVPDADSRFAVANCRLDVEPLGLGLLARDDHVDIVAAAEAMIGN